jgi:predicted small lipoprotein YifL
MRSAVKIAALSAAMALVVAGCGVRGGLEAPPAAKDEATADAQSGQGKPEGTAEKPHKGFILDGLLR